MLLPASPPGRPQPSMRSLIVVGSSSGTLSSAAWMIRAVRSSGRKSLSEPLLARPMGVRAAETITASGMENSGYSAVARSLRTLVRHGGSGLRRVGSEPRQQLLDARADEGTTTPLGEQERREQDAVQRGDERLGRGAPVLVRRLHDAAHGADQVVTPLREALGEGRIAGGRDRQLEPGGQQV